MTWHLGQLVRIRSHCREPRAGIVHRLTRTQVVLRDGQRFVRATGRIYGDKGSVTRIEAWGDVHQGAVTRRKRAA